MRLTPALLTSAAALALASTAASAADLPTKKAAPVEYVRVCSVHGEGFWYIPGTDTCIKISGRVRAEYRYVQTQDASLINGAYGAFSDSFDTDAFPPVLGQTVFPFQYRSSIDANASGMLANGRLNVDVRTSTEWGTLRAFFRYDAYRFSGNFNATYLEANGIESFGLDQAYVQWAGITAGKLSSAFDFYANDLNWNNIAGSDHGTIQFRYTATFGSGFSATISIEDQTTTNNQLLGIVPVPLFGSVNGTDYLQSYYGGIDAGYGGTRVPDIVAALRIDQGWGSAQLSGALHQSRFSSAAIGWGNLITDFNGENCYLPTGFASCGGDADSDWGWAVQAGVKINLPMLAAGDVLYLQAAYADGALEYLGASNIPTSLGYSRGAVSDQQQFLTPYWDDVGGGYRYGFTTKSASGYALTAAGLHYWTPTIRQALFGSYLKIDNPKATYVATGTDPFPFSGFGYGIGDTTVWQVGTNLIWSPVAGLDIGAEVGYINVDNGNTPYAFYTNASSDFGYLNKSSDDRWYARFRIQREF